MKRVIDHIREHLEVALFPSRVPDLRELRESEWDSRFEQLMRNRLLMGAFRYGLIKDRKASEWKALESMRRRLDAYERTGNTENLVDVANLCLLEFREPSVKSAVFHATDDTGEHVERVRAMGVEG